MICAGDFFDKPQVTDMELTALQEIQWPNLPQIFIVGNHESSINGLAYNSTKALETESTDIITEPKILKEDNLEICLLPYIIESDRKQLTDYFGPKTKKRIIISHNDIKGINFGQIESNLGFEISDIESNCDLYLNGHLHNSTMITPKIINLGSITPNNFTNDSTKYKYGIWILDTETLALEFIENPFAFSFYKLDINTRDDIIKLSTLKQNAAVSIKCKAALVKETRDYIATLSNIISSRIIVAQDFTGTFVDETIDLSVDYITRFIECARENLGTDQILEAELAEICK